MQLTGLWTIRNAAAGVGISERTATRRMADPGFRSRVSGLRAELVGVALRQLLSGVRAAVEALMGLLTQPNESVRIRAALKILDLTLVYYEKFDIAERVTVLEEKYKRPVTSGA